MCKGNSDFAHMRLAMEQLQMLVDHVEKCVEQWQSFGEESGIDFQKSLKEAAALRQSLHQIEHQLMETDDHNHSPITITRFK